MQTRKYLVTNSSEGSICITGRNRVDIPGLCQDLQIELPENSARQTVLRLKQHYPHLKITEVKISGSAKSENAGRNENTSNTENAKAVPPAKNENAGSQANPDAKENK